MTTREMDPAPRLRRLLPVRLLAAFGLLGSLASCSVMVDANRPQCSQDSDCTNRGPEFAGSVCSAAGLCGEDPKWSCDAAPTSTGYTLTMHLQDAVDSKKVLPGVVAQLCRQLDVACETPVGATVVSDAGGGITMQIEPGFDGYVQLTDSKIAPSLYFLTPPKSGDLDLPMVPLASPLAARGIVVTAGAKSWLPDRGIVLLNAFDCLGQTAGGITFSLGGAPDPSTVIFYLVDNFPTTTGTATDATGYGGLVNVPVGVATIAGTLGPGGRKVSNTSLLIRAGYVSYSSVTPNSQ
ncbi:MAG TPA: hypothetical protein VJV79_26750 [Polyangiaceae bacterium]|nr:hypothetical protein [Polyangiaceae bacterium]